MKAHQLEEVEGMEGVSWCPVCGGAEGSLPSECPGARMPRLLEQRVYAGSLDFAGGRWKVLKRKGLVIRLTSARQPGCPPGAVDPWTTGAKREAGHAQM